MAMTPKRSMRLKSGSGFVCRQCCASYMLLGRRDDLVRDQDTLLPPERLRVFEGALVYHVENQAVAHRVVSACSGVRRRRNNSPVTVSIPHATTLRACTSSPTLVRS